MVSPRPSRTGMAVLVFAVLILTHPQATFEAAANALAIWWQVVVPALLPFFLVSQLLLRLGVFQFLAAFLEPLTRPLFCLPGATGLVIALGYSSGPPLVASLVAELRRRGLLSREEGEKLLCFTHNASPLFLLGAVPVGMLGNPALGPTLASAHYLANLTLGLLWRWYGRRPATAFPGRGRPVFTALPRVQEEENHPWGSLFQDALWHSCRTLLLVGGYLVMAAVLLALLKDLRLLPPLARCLGFFLGCFSLAPSLGPALAAGLVEMTLGTQQACQTQAPLLDRLTVASLILGWSGLSVHGQVAGVLAGTDLRLAPYLISRLAQALLAALYLPLFLPASLPAFLPSTPLPPLPWPVIFAQSCRLLGLTLALVFAAALTSRIFLRPFWRGVP